MKSKALAATILAFGLQWSSGCRNSQEEPTGSVEVLPTQTVLARVNGEEILTGTITHASPVPVTVGSYPYNVEGSLYEPGDGSAKVFTAFLTLDDIDITVTASTALGTNVLWTDSTLRSTSFDASIIVEKYSNGTLGFTFGGS